MPGSPKVLPIIFVKIILNQNNIFYLCLEMSSASRELHGSVYWIFLDIVYSRPRPAVDGKKNSRVTIVYFVEKKL